MKVLVINGSPSGEQSNTMIITRKFLEGTGYMDVKTINVVDLNINGCRGHFSCWGETPGKCLINDDMKEVLVDLIAADLIIWSFPLYYYSVPGDLKNLIDRQLPLFLPEMSAGTESGSHPARYDLSHQKNILISTCGFWTDKGNYNAVTAMFDYIIGAGNYPTIFSGQGPLLQLERMESADEFEEVKKLIANHLQVVYNAGKEYAQGGISAETSIKLQEPLLSQEDYEQGTNEAYE